MKFGTNLKKLRKLQKLSQEELAEKMRVSRQSISKWETGEAYPEMNHILELCKIFRCRINDLVNDNMLDINSFDEEIRRNVVKFKKEQQKKMKGLSKAISIISKIGRIVCIACIPILVISMIMIAIVVHKVQVEDHEIVWKGNDMIRITEEKDKLTMSVNDKLVADIRDQTEILKVKEILQNHSKLVVLSYVETGFLFLLAGLIFLSIMFQSLENLFHNINHGDTPFTLENVRYIKKIAYFMIAVTILPNIMGAIFESILKMDLNVEFELFHLVEILFLFSIAYIFQYGYEIQLDSKGKMYGDEDE